MFLCVFIEGFFSMFEMACLSLNKVKLHYKASIKNKKAKWLELLLNKPSYLFGTTLILVNTVMQIGSEASRRFYESINLGMHFAPITQIFIVLVFGELAPLFAARRHAEHVAYLSVPIVYFITILLSPLTWIVDKISKAINLIFKKPKSEFFITKEELQKALEEPVKKISKIEKENVNNIVTNIFTLKEKKAMQIMIPFNLIKIIPSNYTIKNIKKVLQLTYFPYFPIYHRDPSNIVGVVYLIDLLKADDENRVIDFAKPPWFITEHMLVIDILKQFRSNNQSIAVVLDKNGKSKGFITLDQIENEIFGIDRALSKKIIETKIMISKTLNGEMTLEEFNKKFKANLQYKDAKTLSDLIISYLGYRPSINEIVTFDQYEFIILETSLLGIEKIKIKTII